MRAAPAPAISRTVIRPERALLAHHLAGVGDPGRRLQPGERPSRRGRPESARRRPRGRPRACRPRRHRRVLQRRRIEHRPLVARARRRPAAGEPAREIQRQRRRLGQRRAPRCACRRGRDDGRASRSQRRSSVPRTSIGPVPGSSENSNDLSAKLRSTRAVVRIVGGGRARRAATSAAGRPPAARSRLPFGPSG